MTAGSLRASLPEATAVTLLRRYSTDPQLDEAAEKLSNCARTFKQYLAAIVVNMLGFVFGTALGWPAMAGPQLIAPDVNKTGAENATAAFGNWTELDLNATAAPDVQRPLPGPPVTLEAMSWIVAVLCVSCVVGTFIFGWLADLLGRKRAALIGAVPYVASWLCVIFADEVAWLFVARVLAGLGGGSSLVVCPLYVGETSEDSLRGMLGSLFSVMLTAGILFSFVVGSFASFRALAVVCLTLPCFFFVAFLWMPDTPVFLLSRGKVPLAVRSLTWLRGGRVDLVDDELAKLVANMKDGAEDSGGGSGQAPSQLAVLRQLVATRAARRALFIVMFLFTVQQWCGINAILSFTVQIFREAGSTMEPNSATIIVGVLQLVGVCSATLVVDRLGRRVLLVVSYVSMCTCLLILGGVFYMKATDQDVSSIGWLPVLCLSMYSVTYALGAGPVPFILVSELFPSSVRSLATSISISFCSILAFIVTKFFEDICHNIGQFGAMWVFACCSLAGALFAWFGVIETKGKPLAVILHELEGRRGRWPDPRTGPFAGGTKTFNPAPGDIYYSPPDRADDREEAEAAM